MFPIFLPLSENKVLEQNGPYISTNQTILRNVCVCNAEILSVAVVCGLVFSQSGLHRGLKKLLKIPFDGPNDPSVAGFLIFLTVYFLCVENTALSLEKNLEV